MGWLMCLCLLIFLVQGQVNCSSSFSSNSSSTQLCPHDQSFALLQLKNIFSFNSSASNPWCDKSYPKMLKWEEGVDCCSWDGVLCDWVTGHVISLDLSCSWLQGTIHSNSSLFLLPHLQRLNLALNDFDHSQISSKFGRFASLTHLNLSSSVFSGHIPSEISHLSKLVSLDLSYNRDRSAQFYLLRLNTSNMKILVQNLTKLIELNLDGVNMSSVELGSLRNLSSSLTALGLWNCGLRGKFPDNIFHLPNLQKLNLSINYDLIIYFPKVNWSSPLEILGLSGTSVSGIFESISYLQSLNHLVLTYCNFSGSIPASLGNLTQISYLRLSHNLFNGSIPAWLGNLTQISFLELSHNNFSGQIPSSLSKLEQLTYLGLSHNLFSGSIPAWLGNLTKIFYLGLSYNNFSGQIPSSLSKLEQLTYLLLSHNHFNGSIPASLGNLTQVSYLDLSSNNFSGQIPLSLSKLVQLTYLTLSVNHFNGHFSSPGVEQLPWKNLQYLDLHSNMLQGPLPVPSLTMTFFSISNNKMTGEIPSLICNVSSHEILNLSNNNLSGVIPQCLGNFAKKLSVLDLRMNIFRGTIPKTFAKGNSLRNIALNGNQLKGPIPRSLINCEKLQVLDLGNNKIKDTFPYWLETLPQLQVLVLRFNRFHGSIRGSKVEHPFPKLRIFDLSNNDFTGPLPTKYLKNLKAMTNVDNKKFVQRYMGDQYYQDSVKVTMKGLDIELVKILTIFTTLDLSNNSFRGEIPKLIGKLTSLILLNFSHNSLTGHIPSSLENLRNLESLDLSSNNISGEIPGELTSLTFLAVLNLSQNHLVGPIPRGKQFDTFQNDSYCGNLELCGIPLSKKCSDDEAPQSPPLIFKEEDDLGFASGFEWKVVLMGYGCGMVFGLVMGYLIFLTGKPKWFVRIVEGKLHKMVKKSNKSAHRRGGRRN